MTADAVPDPRRSGPEDPAGKRRRRTAVAVFLVVLAMIPFGTGPWTGQVPYLSDIANTFHPLRSYSHAVLSEGGIPWWNPHTVCGVPHVADPQAAFWYPPSWVLDRMDPGVAIVADAFSHVLLGAALMYALCRALGRSAAASCFAASAFVLGETLFNEIQAPPPLRSLAWTPGAMLGVVWMRRGEVRRGFLAVAASWAGSLLGGHAQFTLVSLPVVSALAFAPGARMRDGVRVLGIAGAALALGGAVAAIALVPGVAYGPWTQRAFGFSPEGVARSALPPEALLRPFFARTERFGGLSWGLAPLALAVFAFARSPRHAAPLAAAAAFGALVALGTHTPAGRLVASVPPWSFFHYYERNLATAGLALVLLSAEGLDAWIAGSIPLRTRLGSVAVVAAATTAAVLADRGEPSSRDAVRLGFGALAAAALVLRRGPRPVRTGVAWVLLGTAELVTLNGRKYWTPGRMAEPARLRAVPQDVASVPRDSFDGTVRTTLGLTDRHHRTRVLPYRLDCTSGHFPLIPWRLLLLADFVETGVPASPGPIDGPRYHLGPEVRDSPLLDLFGVRYTIRRPDAPSGTWEPLAGGVWRRDTRSGILSVVGDAVFATSVEGVQKALGAPSFDPSATVVVEGEAAAGDAPDGAGGDLPRIAARRRDASGFEADLTPGRGAWFVAAYNHIPGFRCEIDGAEVPIRTANVAFMAVRLPPGARKVVFRYFPPGFATGAIVTGAGLAVAAAVALSGRRRAPSPEGRG